MNQADAAMIARAIMKDHVTTGFPEPIFKKIDEMSDKEVMVKFASCPCGKSLVKSGHMENLLAHHETFQEFVDLVDQAQTVHNLQVHSKKQGKRRDVELEMVPVKDLPKANEIPLLPRQAVCHINGHKNPLECLSTCRNCKKVYDACTERDTCFCSGNCAKAHAQEFMRKGGTPDQWANSMPPIKLFRIAGPMTSNGPRKK